MNLLFILPSYEPAWSFGGVVRCISALCRELAGLGHKVTVYTTNADGTGGSLGFPCGEPVDLGGVTTYFFPPTFGPKSIWDSRALSAKLRRSARNFDLIYLSAIWQWLGISASFICNRLQVPLVIGPHGSFDKLHLRTKPRRKLLYWRLFLKRALSRASALHLTTEHERQESSQLLRTFESFIVPNGLDCVLFRPITETRGEFRREHGLHPENPVMITVGRPDQGKRVDLLIKAMNYNDCWQLLVVGSDEGEVAHEWKALARKLNVAQRVKWTGYLEGEELLQAYSAADIFALMSRDENFGMVVIEALSCGLPILVSQGVGVWEEVKDAGVGKAVGLEAQEIAQALDHFVSNRAWWQTCAENAIQVVEEGFAIKKVAELMAQAFQDVLHGTRSKICRWNIAGKYPEE